MTEPNNPAPPTIPSSTSALLTTAQGQPLPLRSVRLQATARGGLARVRLIQSFVNPYPEVLHLQYKMPLPYAAAVAGFNYTLNGLRVDGRVRPRKLAQQAYTTAVQAGHTAALVEQQRGDFFQQSLGQIPPHAELNIELELDQMLDWLAEGWWAWRFPTVLGPRYLGPPGRVTDATTLELTPMGPHRRRRTGMALDFSVHIEDLHDGRATSSSHALDQRSAPEGGVQIHLAAGRNAQLDRDVVIRWPASSQSLAPSLQSCRPPHDHPESEHAFALLSCTPPLQGDKTPRVARELVVLLDTSGSMADRPLAQAKRVISALIDSLTAEDQLMLWAFASEPECFHAQSVAATTLYKSAAQRWLETRVAGGATEMRSGLSAALAGSHGLHHRQVILVTDGYIGFEAEIVADVLAAQAPNRSPQSRIHTLGIGNAVNRALTQGVARAGGGHEAIIAPGEDVEPVVQRLLAHTAIPQFVDIEVSGSALLQQAPTTVPDLLAGCPSRIWLKLRPEGGSLRISGRTATAPWSHHWRIKPHDQGQGQLALARGYARAEAEDIEMRRLANPADAAACDRSLTALGEAFQISTRLNSWVATAPSPTAGPGLGERHEKLDPRPVHGCTEAASHPVHRDARGVIIGHASRAPKILGYIEIPKRSTAKSPTREPSSTPGRATRRKLREAQFSGRSRPRTKRGRPLQRTNSATPGTQPMRSEKKRVRMTEALCVAELARQLQIKTPRVIRELWNAGLRSVTAQTELESAEVELVAQLYGYTVHRDSPTEAELLGTARPKLPMVPRPAIIALMGHVDHGKTSLLDRICQTRRSSAEAGGITQAIGLVHTELASGPALLLDTPGHTAFAEMRSLGLDIADLLLIVVAADAGLQSTSLEVIERAKSAGLAVVVFINKVELPQARPDWVRQQLLNAGVLDEHYGGDVCVLSGSVKTGEGLSELLDALSLQIELLEPKACPLGPAFGRVLDAQLMHGHGPVARVLVESGQLQVGDHLVCGQLAGRVKRILTTSTGSGTSVGPGTAAELVGLAGMPEAGARFDIVANEHVGQQVVQLRKNAFERMHSATPRKLRTTRTKVPRLSVIVCCGNLGSARALQQLLTDLSHPRVAVEVIATNIGAPKTSDLTLAMAASALVVCFSTKPTRSWAAAATVAGIKHHHSTTVYEAEAQVKSAMLGLLPPEYEEQTLGRARVTQVFEFDTNYRICGCRVVEGLVRRGEWVRVHRDGQLVHRGQLSSLRIEKTDAKLVEAGRDCGIIVADFRAPRVGDELEVYGRVPRPARL